MAEEGEPVKSPRRSFAKILVVDDEPVICELVRTILERIGTQVICASSVEGALERIPQEQLELLFLDASMSPLNGYDLLRMLRANPETQHLPAVILWARSPDVAQDHQWQPGADYYLQKPINPMELIKMVQEGLDILKTKQP